MLVFQKEGKTEKLGKKLSDQGQNQNQTQPGEDSQLISDKKAGGERFHY